MKVLITGKGGNAGSWQIRGVQLGRAIGATVLPMATTADCLAHDIVIVVKRTPPELINAVRHSGRPWVLDIVDGWPQPCHWGEADALAWLYKMLSGLRPTAAVFGTPEMLTDASPSIPALILPHHSWERYIGAPGPSSAGPIVVGYEGDPRYLGAWHARLVQECERRGWLFEVNGDMRRAHIGVALRDGGGYPAQWWKPGTKLSNLHALGIPALCSPEAGYKSVAAGAECWIQSPADLARALNRLESAQVRAEMGRMASRGVIRLADVAAKYLQWLREIAQHG